mgnify:CR=1 FL=1
MDRKEATSNLLVGYYWFALVGSLLMGGATLLVSLMYRLSPAALAIELRDWVTLVDSVAWYTAPALFGISVILSFVIALRSDLTPWARFVPLAVTAAGLALILPLLADRGGL